MDYRVLESIHDLEAAFALEIAVWGLDPRDAVPVNLLRALQHSGGVLIGAYVGEQLVGITLGFPARSGDRWILWSHMTGVDQNYQGRNIGFALKQHQRAWALANDFDEIRWTFDPLQRGNANFNLHRLGATAEQYHINFYGVMNDEINHADLPSDRVEGVWRLRDPRVIERIGIEPPPTPTPNHPALLTIDEDRPLVTALNANVTQTEYLVQIPASLTQLAGSLLEWRLALRAALMNAFEHGYIAVDFTSTNAYLLQHL